MSDDQLEEYERILDHDHDTIVEWIGRFRPDFLTDELFQRIADAAPPDAGRLDVLGEYAAVAWLHVHRPDHRDIVARERSALIAELQRDPHQFLQRAA